MVTYLLKKSYQHKTLKEINFNDLWGDNGVFTTMWIFNKPPKILFFKNHIKNLIKSLKVYKLYKPNIEKMLSWLKPNGLLIMRHKKDSGDNLEERKKSLGSWAGEGSWPRSRINEFTSAFNLKLEWIENHSATRNNIKFDGHVWCWRKYV